MVLPMLVAVTLGLVWLLSVGAAQVRTVDAVRETARALARGDDRQAAIGRGVRVGVPGTQVTTSGAGARIVVTAQAQVRGPGGIFGSLPAVRVHARAVAAGEGESS
ncbi:hypothetical protein JCM18899A_09780 [Nocardioides sp. AN3]